MNSSQQQRASVFNFSFWQLVVFVLASAGILTALVVQHVGNIQENTLTEAARIQSVSATTVREFYTEHVVGAIKDIPGITVTHDFSGKKGAIPLPATLTMELGQRLQSTNGVQAIQLLSDQPFLWRQDRLLDNFQIRALNHFREGGKGEFIETSKLTTGPQIRYATAVTMQQGCVDCHNSHEASPNLNWKVGDIRGIQEVRIAFPPPGNMFDNNLYRVLAAIMGIFTICILLIIYQTQCHRKTLLREKELADSEMEKGSIAAAAEKRARESQNQALDSEHRTRLILDTITDAIITVDEKLNIVSANFAVERIFGYQASSLLGQSLLVLFNDEELQKAATLLEDVVGFSNDGDVMLANTATVDLTGLGKDGGDVPITLRVRGVVIDGVPHFVCAVRDISQRKMANMDKYLAETRLQDAINALPAGFVLYDRSDRLVMCNAKYKEMYAITASIMQPGTKFEDIIRYGAEQGQITGIGEGQELENWIEKRMEVHNDPQGIVEYELADGRWIRVHEQRTEEGGVVGFRVDITELKNRERALSGMNRQYWATMASSIDGVIVMDENGKVVEFNEAAEELFGIQRDVIIGNLLVDHVVPERYRKAHIDGLKRYKEQGSGGFIGQRIEIEALRGNGEEFLAEISINSSKTEDGKYLFVAYMRDITNKKANETDLIEAKEQAEIASRAKSSFLAIMSHEIRTPLNGLMGLLTLMRDTELNLRQKRYVDTAQESGRSLMRILNDILDYSKLEAGKMELEQSTFALEHVFKSVIDLMRPRAREKRIDLSLNIKQPVPTYVDGDPGRMRQILLNLIGNAIKFTDKGGVVVTLSSDMPLATSLSIESIAQAEIRVDVTDTGPGIAKDKCATLFGEFTTVDASYARKFGGTGLGLAICRQLVHLMGGEIKVASELGEGSSFWFSLNLQIGQQAGLVGFEQGAEESIQVGALKGMQILLAEDNQTNQLVMSDMLHQEGCRVDSVFNGREAVFQAKWKAYDIILMDISMPEMDGYEAIKRIRAFDDDQCDVPIIALTAYASLEDRERFIGAGANDVSAKPVDRQALFASMASLTKGRKRAKQTGLILQPPKDMDPEAEIFTSPIDDDKLNEEVADDNKETTATTGFAAAVAKAPVTEKQKSTSAGSDQVGKVVMKATMPRPKTESVTPTEEKSAPTTTEQQEHVQQSLSFRESTLKALFMSASPATRSKLEAQFLSDIAAQTEALQDALHVNDIETIEKISHTIKSVAGIFGASVLSQTADQINRLARTNKEERTMEETPLLISQAQQAMEQFPEAVSRITQAMGEYA